MQKPSSSSSKHSRASSSGSKSANSYSITRGLDIANQIVLGIITDGGPRNTKHEAVNSRAKDPAAQTAAKSAKQQQGPIDSAGPIPSLSQHAESHANWKSTAYNAAKLTLDLVKEGSGAFPPLQTVTGLLSSIIAQYDISVGNRESVSRLLPRVEGLQHSLTQPPMDGDHREAERRRVLTQKFEETSANLEKIVQQGKILGFLNNTEDAGTISGLVEDIRDAILDYQTSIQQDIHDKSFLLIESSDLNLLDKLPHARDAGYDAGDRNKCLRDTRVGVLQQIEDWFLNIGDLRIHWLNGLAGTGKTTIAQSFSEYAFAEGRLGASFFCSRDSLDRSNVKLIFPSISFQLAYRFPEFRVHVLSAIRSDPDIGHASLSVQFEKLIVQPLKASGLATVIVLDALDECSDEEPVSTILSLISRHAQTLNRTKFFITSRPEPNIRSAFRIPLLRPLTEIFLLHGVAEALVERDIRIFLRYQLSKLANRSDVELPMSWPTEDAISALAKKCGGLFIFGFTACKFVSSPYHDPVERLQLVVHMKESTTYEGQAGIDPLYTQILKQGFAAVSLDEKSVFSQLRLVVGCILLLFNPMSGSQIATLLNMTPKQVNRALRSLHSVLMIPDSDSQPIRTFHASFFDYLTDPKRCTDARFYIQPFILHSEIVVRCLDLMKISLKRNICDIPRYALNDEVDDLSARRKDSIGESLIYACKHWVGHLQSSSLAEDEVSKIMPVLKDFAEHRLLFWVEVISIDGDMSIAVRSIQGIQSWLESAKVQDTELIYLLKDARRFVLDFYDLIGKSASHIYHSALPFTPLSSKLRQRYQHELTGEVKLLNGDEQSWNPSTRTSYTYAGTPHAISFSPDGSKMLVGCSKSVAKIFEMATGRCSITLEGHTGYVLSAVFTNNGDTTLTACSHGIIMVSDVQTGAVIKSKSLYEIEVNLRVCFSPDGGLLAACGSEIYIWDVATCELIGILEGHQTRIEWIAWSKNSSYLVSGSQQGSVKLWDIPRKRWMKDLVGSSSADVLSVAFSLDGTRVVGGFTDGSIAVWDVESGKNVTTIRLNSIITAVSFFGDKDHIAFAARDGVTSGSYNSSVQVWDLLNKICVNKFAGHSQNIQTIAVAPNYPAIASGAGDGTVKLWEMTDAVADSSNDAPQSITILTSICFSPDGTRIAAGSSAGIVMICNSRNGSELANFSPSDFVTTELSAESKWVTSVALSPDNCTVAAGFRDSKVRIWNILTGKLLHLLEGHPVEVDFVAFTMDGTRVVSAAKNDSNANIRVWSLLSGECLIVFPLGPSIGYVQLYVSPMDDTGSQIVCSLEKTMDGDRTVVRWRIPAISDSSTQPMFLELLPHEEFTFSNYLPEVSRMYKNDPMEVEWILDEEERSVCWLPESRRSLAKHLVPVVSACHGSKVAVGGESGRLTILDFPDPVLTD